VFTFAAPFKKFIRMAGNMDESFLITESWKKVKRRIAGSFICGPVLKYFERRF